MRDTKPPASSLLSNPLPPLSSSVHFTERRIGFAWCSFQSTMVSISRLAGLYMLRVSGGCMWNLSEQLPNHGPQCRSDHITIVIWKDFNFVAYKHFKCGSKCCGVLRGSLVLIRHQLGYGFICPFVAEERKGCSSNTKGGATFFCVCEILCSALKYLQSTNCRGTIIIKRL